MPRLTVLAVLTILAFFGPVVSSLLQGYVPATIGGKLYQVPDNRRPSLYTKDYGDCMGGSSINVTRFDAAFYKDNMTVLFHLVGETGLMNETIMSEFPQSFEQGKLLWIFGVHQGKPHLTLSTTKLKHSVYIGVCAYGEARFDRTFDPCRANIDSACPLRMGTTVEARGIVPISENDVASIPPIALSIPDFEGQAILRLFSNATESEIGCYSAVVTNGNSFSQQPWVSSILGAFTALAVLSSFATAVYGENTLEIRKHYAHSCSVSVVFSVWHHIYFSGALSMNWPSVLVAFWNNYAWAGGMIYSESMQNTINEFIGSNKGNTSSVGAAGTETPNPAPGGGFDLQELYRRYRFRDDSHKFGAKTLMEMPSTTGMEESLNAFSWYGHPVKPGIPLPGNYSGFAGTLAQESIPASNAFMTGLMWLLVFIASALIMIVVLKIILEVMSSFRIIKRDRLLYFRKHWRLYLAFGVFRTLYIGFFPISFLTLFQLSQLGSDGLLAVPCSILVATIVGVGALAALACIYRIEASDYALGSDRLNIIRTRFLKVIPWIEIERNSRFPRSEDKEYYGSILWWRVVHTCEERCTFDDEDYTKRFGWLSARFRKSKWWFFAVWLIYDFARASFLAGAAGSPIVQAAGLFAVELIGFIGLIILRPYEGQRLNAIVVYLLSISKIATVALSVMFLPRLGFPRIVAVVIGIGIIIIQGILTIAVLIVILLGAFTSYLSIMRNRETIRPQKWGPVQRWYLNHLDFRAKDIARPGQTRETLTDRAGPELDSPKEAHFTVREVRRVPKVEDEDEEFMTEINGGMSASQLSLTQPYRNSSNGAPLVRQNTASTHSSRSYTNMPYGARVHRTSWSTPDLAKQFALAQPKTPSVSVGSSEDSSRPACPVVVRPAKVLGGEGIALPPSSVSVSRSGSQA